MSALTVVDSLQVDVLVPEDHWLSTAAQRIIKEIGESGVRGHIVHSVEASGKGNILFVLGWPAKLQKHTLLLHRYNLVPHASKVPENRGWSPWVWAVIDGSDVITLSWIEAAQEIDSGVIYLQEQIQLDGSELLPEIQAKLADSIVSSAIFLVKQFPESLANPSTQVGSPTYRRRRVPQDSEIDPNVSISEQFDLLRTVDNQEYPAFFYFRGRKYKLTIEAAKTT